MKYHNIYQHSIRIFLGGCLFILGGLFITAQAQSSNDSEKIELIHQLIEISQEASNSEIIIKEGMREGMREVIDHLDGALTEEGDAGQISQEEEAQLQVFIDNMSNNLDNSLNDAFTEEDITNILVPLYDKNFTTEDIKNMIDFYQTPTGQKIISTDLEFSQEFLKEFDQQFGANIVEELEMMMISSMFGSFADMDMF